MRTSTKLHSSEKRTKKQQKLTPAAANQKGYTIVLAEIRKLETKRGKFEQQIEKVLAPVKASLGVDKLEQQIFAIDDQIDDLWGEKERLENLIIDRLAEGKGVVGFVLRIVAKRTSVSYKSLCEELKRRLNLTIDEFRNYKDRFGGRKEQYVLLFKDEEVAKRNI